MELSNPVDYFFDPILRAPTIASMLMCFSAGLVGAFVFLRKQSLLGEALSHAAYPGVILGVIASGMLGYSAGNGFEISLLIILGAFLTALLGTWTINFLTKKCAVKTDAALCFVLSGFFGVGLTLASQVQFAYSSLYQQIQVYLYGQAATMTEIHIRIYALLAFVILLAVVFLYKEVQLISFDQNYAKSLGYKTAPIEAFFFMITVFAVVVGIRSVGVVLMSAMLIAPASAARQFTNQLSVMLALSAFFGLISGFLGNYFSVEFTNYLLKLYPGERLSIPTGPAIVMVAASICLFSLLLAPKRGMLIRLYRIAKFRYRCTCENILKSIWRIGPTTAVSFDELSKYHMVSLGYMRFLLKRLEKNGWIKKVGKSSFCLTQDGAIWASKIVRLHRLWEVYLVDYLGVGAERVHRSAEEMEHIITPSLERELTALLNNPTQDPHKQPIPPLEEL